MGRMMRNASSVQSVFVQLLAAVSFGASALTTVAIADEYASPERTAAAVGHYARARSLLVQALDEFEQGRKIARPDLLLDSEEFRISLVSRAEELNRVLDPQPKVTRSGVRFKGAPDLVRDPRSEKVSSGLSAPETKASNSNQADTFGLPGRGALAATAGKKEPAANKAIEKPKAAAIVRKKESRITVKTEPPAVNSEVLTIAPEAPAADVVSPDAPSIDSAVKPDANAAPAAAAHPAAADSGDEDPEVKQAIEQAIKERLDRIKAETDPVQVKQ